MLMLMLTKDTKEPWSPQQPEPNPGETSPNTAKGFGGMSAKEFQDHLERLKNNVRAEVPDCSCFPPDKCKRLELYIYILAISKFAIMFCYLINMCVSILHRSSRTRFLLHSLGGSIESRRSQEGGGEKDRSVRERCAHRESDVHRKGRQDNARLSPGQVGKLLHFCQFILEFFS